MEKESDPRVRESRTQERGHQHQLVVMNPDDVARLDDTRDRFRVELIHLAIGIPPDSVERDAIDEVMKQGPDHTVAKPVVVLGDLLTRQVNRFDPLRA